MAAPSSAALQAWIHSADGFVVYRLRVRPGADAELDIVSPSLRSVMGVEPTAPFPTWFDGIHPDEREAVEAESTRAALAEERFEATMRIRHPDHDGWRWVQAISTPVRDGGELYFNGLIVDVTTVKEAEARARQLQEQLDLAQRMETVGLLASGVAHDLNNGLAVLRAHAELARRADDPETASGHIETLLRQVDQAAELTAQLLGYAGQGNFRSASTDLVEVFSTVSSMLGRTRKDVTIGLDVPDRAFVRADPSQIERVAVNLLINAFEAMPDGGEIDVVIVTQGATHVVEVADDGVGMSAELAARVFEPFVTTRGESGRRSSGLGLAASRGIVEATGGTIGVRSRPGFGSVFRLELPADVEPVPDGAVIGAPLPPDADPLGVLVVDDEAMVREAVVALLEALGHRPTAVASGAAALRALSDRQADFDVALVDYVMPGVSGVELLRRLRAASPTLRLVVCSGFMDPIPVDDEVAGVTVLRKPFSAAQLSAAVVGG